MKNQADEAIERLIRVRAMRRGKPVELRVHYERAFFNGCETFQIFSLEDIDFGTGTN